MNTKTPKCFRTIGSGVAMQTICWDDEIKLIDGLFYDIAFDKDFSQFLVFDERPLTAISITSVIEEIKRLEEKQDQLNFIKAWLFEPIQSPKKPNHKKHSKTLKLLRL